MVFSSCLHDILVSTCALYHSLKKNEFIGAKFGIKDDNWICILTSAGKIQAHMAHWFCLLTEYSIVDAAIILGLLLLYKDPTSWDTLHMFLLGGLSSSNTFSAAEVWFLRRWSSSINWLQWDNISHSRCWSKHNQGKGNPYHKVWKTVEKWI